MSPDDPRHGTTAGYNAHRYQGEKACRGCKAAAATYFARREMALARGETYTVAARGSIRRIRALVAIGWSMEHQAARLGLKKQAIQNFAVKSPDTRIRVTTAKRYSDLFDELHMTPGPSDKAREIAVRKGWAPPLAWEDIDSDEAPDMSAIPRGRRRAVAQVEATLRPECGTRKGYNTHRYLASKGIGEWPLPDDDPCGCREAHRAYEAEKYRRRRDAA